MERRWCGRCREREREREGDKGRALTGQRGGHGGGGGGGPALQRQAHGVHVARGREQRGLGLLPARRVGLEPPRQHVACTRSSGGSSLSAALRGAAVHLYAREVQVVSRVGASRSPRLRRATSPRSASSRPSASDPAANRRSATTLDTCVRERAGLAAGALAGQGARQPLWAWAARRQEGRAAERAAGAKAHLDAGGQAGALQPAARVDHVCAGGTARTAQTALARQRTCSSRIDPAAAACLCPSAPPKMVSLGLCMPTTTATTGPACRPMRTWIASPSRVASPSVQLTMSSACTCVGAGAQTCNGSSDA